MYENQSIHYHAICSKRASPHGEPFRCIQKNKELKELWGLIYHGNFNAHKMKDLIEYVENKSKIFYYFHEYNSTTKEYDSLVFKSYKEFKDVINKDLEKYKQEITIPLTTGDGNEAQINITTTDRIQTEAQTNERITTPPNRISSGDIGDVRGDTVNEDVVFIPPIDNIIPPPQPYGRSTRQIERLQQEVNRLMNDENIYITPPN